MKKYLWVLILSVLYMAKDIKAQSVKSFPESAIIEPFKLEVGYNKTTHLVFPFPVISIDRGCAGILAQKATGVENILKVKADQKGFEETNLSVITSDGKLYSFLVCYSGSPAYLNINLDSTVGEASINPVKQKVGEPLNEALLTYFAKQAIGAERNIYGLGTRSSKASLHLEGVYVKESALFLRLRLQNGSAINYDIDQFRLFVRNKVQSRRTAIQEREIEALFTEGDITAIRANSTQTIVLAVPAFTIPKDKYLAIELTEKGGGRNFFYESEEQTPFEGTTP